MLRAGRLCAVRRAMPALRALPSPALALSTASAPRSVPKRPPHAVLGVPADATPEQIKFAYYQLAMKEHPDRSAEADAAERFNEIGLAYSALLGEDPQARREASGGAEESAKPQPHIRKPEHVTAYAEWVYELVAYLQRVPQRLDLWLPPSYASVIYQHLRANELAEALEVLEEQKRQGEVPTHAVYEMLIRGCTIAMRRVARRHVRPGAGRRRGSRTPRHAGGAVAHRPPTARAQGPGEEADHLTENLMAKVVELWSDMTASGRKPDYLTYNELIRAYGKAGRVKEAMVLFEHMCGNVLLLPEERALNSMYELCVLSGHYEEAMEVFEQHEELRKSVWRPRFTPVSFSLLLTACAEAGPGRLERIEALPRVLSQMRGYGVLPREEACERLLAACLEMRQLPTARQVLQLASRAGHKLDPRTLESVDRLELELEAEAVRKSAHISGEGADQAAEKR